MKALRRVREGGGGTGRAPADAQGLPLQTEEGHASLLAPGPRQATKLWRSGRGKALATNCVYSARRVYVCAFVLLSVAPGTHAENAQGHHPVRHRGQARS